MELRREFENSIQSDGVEKLFDADNKNNTMFTEEEIGELANEYAGEYNPVGYQGFIYGFTKAIELTNLSNAGIHGASAGKKVKELTIGNESKLIMMVGLPRSGKSTEAKKLGYPIVSPDAIRLAYGTTFNKELEHQVWATAMTMVKALFLAGHNNVILDATNTTNERRDFWRSKKWRRVFFEINTSKEVCLSRLTSKNQYLVDVINRMSERYEPISPNLDIFSITD